MGTVNPIILSLERDEGGVLWAQLRLSDGRTGWIRAGDVKLDEEGLVELDRVLLARLATRPTLP
jgi:hypothetical protein